MKNTLIIGGGLGGLVTSIILARNGIRCVMIEKKLYPLHKVCGEYISNEAAPFLKRSLLFPEQLLPPQINRFQLSSSTGRQATISLDLGGFGISRFNFDHHLYKIALSEGVIIHLKSEVGKVTFTDGKFLVETGTQSFESDVVVGAFGKRSKLDITLSRNFIKKRSPYAGVKYHLRTDHPGNLISLHNFEGGYCGISPVENNVTNLCYLTHRDPLKKLGSIEVFEKEVLWKNPFLKSVFLNSDFLFEKPEVINEISFETKSPVENHILMVGDASGMIAPVCGNGMAMAIHAGKIAAELVTAFCKGKISRLELEQSYSHQWRQMFAQRLWNGRQVQKLFGNRTMSNIAVNMALNYPPIANFIVRNTHGKVF